MARPREFDKEAAIDIVMNEIWQNGFEAASVKSLAEKLCITRSSFYNAFGSRESLFGEVFQRYTELSPTKMLMEMTPETPFKPAITRLFLQICSERATDKEVRGCLAVNCAAELLHRKDELGAFMAEVVASSLGRFEELIGWAVKRGELDPDTDPRALALTLQNLLMGINLLSKAITNEQELWASASTTLKALGLYHEIKP